MDSVSLPRAAAVSDGHHLRHDAQYRKQRHQSFAPSRSPRAHPLEGAPEQRAAADPQAGVTTRPVASNTCGDQSSITLSQFHSATPPPLEPEVHRLVPRPLAPSVPLLPMLPTTGVLRPPATSYPRSMIPTHTSPSVFLPAKSAAKSLRRPPLHLRGHHPS